MQDVEPLMVVNTILILQVPGIQQKAQKRSTKQTCVEPLAREKQKCYLAEVRYTGTRARLAAMKVLSMVRAGNTQDQCHPCPSSVHLSIVILCLPHRRHTNADSPSTPQATVP